MKRNIMILASVIGSLITLFAQAAHQPSQTIKSDNVTIVDGDTLKLGEQKVRLWGIDAPELHQTCFKQEQEIECGKAAKLALMAIIKSGALTCEVIATDRYKRDVARCSIDNLDVGRLLVMAGWALNYEQYSKGYYKRWEDEARLEKHGLWDMTFTPPWEWRKGTRVYGHTKATRVYGHTKATRH